jgi:integrase
MFESPDIWAPLKLNTKPTRRETKLVWAPAKEILVYLGRYLPKQRLIRAITILSDERKRRFLRRRMPKYGSMNKGFTDEELIKFMSALEDEKMVLLFSYQAILGLRIGEAVRIHIRDINLKKKELRIDTEKGKRIDYLPIPQQLFDKTLNFITQNEYEIASHKGFLFWSECYPGRNDCPHIHTNYARTLFQKAVKRAGIDETYAVSVGETSKLLHRLTPHSLRHYAITNHAKRNNGNIVLTSKFARHRDIDTTMIYIHSDKEELYRSVITATEDGILEKVKKLQNGLL